MIMEKLNMNNILPRWRCEVQESHDKYLIAVFVRAENQQEAVKMIHTMYSPNVKVSVTPDKE